MNVRGSFLTSSDARPWQGCPNISSGFCSRSVEWQVRDAGIECWRRSVARVPPDCNLFVQTTTCSKKRDRSFVFERTLGHISESASSFRPGVPISFRPLRWSSGLRRGRQLEAGHHSRARHARPFWQRTSANERLRRCKWFYEDG